MTSTMIMPAANAGLHWAAPLIGKPWGPEPDDNCWGLVRQYFRLRHALELPLVATGEDNAAAIKAAVQLSDWRRVDGPPQVDDVVLMWCELGRHAGVMIHANRRLGVLHANGCMRDGVPIGCVVFQTLAEATSDGYGDYEFWRCQA